MRKLLIMTIAGGLSGALIGCGSGDSTCDPEEKGTICTVAGNGKRGRGEEGLPAVEVRLDVPQDMVLSPEGELWVLDFNNYMIKVIDDDGNMNTVVGTGLLGDSPPPDQERIPATQALFNHTTDLFFHDGYVYLAAWHNSRVKRIDLDTMMLENYAGIGRRTYYHGDGGDALAAALDLPSSIAPDPDGNIVVMDQANQVIRMVDQDGIIHRVAGTCVVDYDVPCEEGQVPAACPDSNKTTCGDLETECGKECTPGYGGDDGPALEARLAQPFGQMAAPAGRLAFDGDGNLFFSDTSNHRIRKVDTDGIISTVAGTGDAGDDGDGGPATEARINTPVDIEVAENGDVYFADTSNNCIRRIDGDGIIETVAGICSDDPDDRGFDGDGGPPTEALLDRPAGIELADDRMWIADSYNHRIRVVNF
jgi:sugar lactone lactonase YvrE